MNTKKIVFVSFLCLLFIIPNVILALPSVNDIMKAIDKNTGLTFDMTAKVRLTQQKEGEGVKISECIYYRRDVDNSFLIVMSDPELEKGNGYLKQNDNMWMYRRNTRTFQHMNRDESIAGTGAKSEDFEKQMLTDIYKPSLDKSGKDTISETKIGDVPVYQFDLDAKIENVAFPKKTFWVTKDTFLPLKAQSYSLSGTLMQTSYFLKYTQFQGGYLFTKAMFIDEFEKGNKTVLELLNVSSKKIDDYVFTKAYLENLSM